MINHPQPQHQITTDASLTGWGLNLRGCPQEEIGLIQSRNTTLPYWPTQAWYPAAPQLLRGKPVHLEAGKDLLQLPSHPKETHPMWHKLSFLVCLLSRRDWTNMILSQCVKDVLMASWREGTSKQYQTYLNKWQQYCRERNIDVFEPSIANGIEFIVSLHKQGWSIVL